MADSKNKLVWVALIAACETITTANGYSVDVVKVRDRDLRASAIPQFPELQVVFVGDQLETTTEKKICNDRYTAQFTIRQYLEADDDGPTIDLAADVKAAIEAHVDGVWLGLPWVRGVKVASNDVWNITDETRRDRVRLNVAIVDVQIENQKGNPYAP